MLFLLFLFLSSPAFADTYIKISEDTLQITKEEVSQMSARQWSALREQLVEAKANTDQASAGYQAQIDAGDAGFTSNAMDWRVIIVAQEVVKP